MPICKYVIHEAYAEFEIGGLKSVFDPIRGIYGQ